MKIIKKEKVFYTKYSIILNENIGEVKNLIEQMGKRFYFGIIFNLEGKHDGYWVETEQEYFARLNFGDEIFYIDTKPNFKTDLEIGWYCKRQDETKNIKIKWERYVENE